MRGEIKIEAFLGNLALFRGTSELDLERLAAATTRRKLARGECLFREGEPALGLWAVLYGRIKLVTFDESKRETHVDLVGAGHTFGETMMFLDRPYIVRASALVDTLVLQVARDAVFELLQRDGAFAHRLVRTLAERIEWLVRERNELALGTARERLVAWLLRRSELRGARPVVVRLPTAKRVLAARLGFRAEHFSRVLRELVAGRMLEVHGRELRILDPSGLRAWQAGEGPQRNPRAPRVAPAAAAERREIART